MEALKELKGCESLEEVVYGGSLDKATFVKKKLKGKHCDVWKIYKGGRTPLVFFMDDVETWGMRIMFDLRKFRWNKEQAYFSLVPNFEKKVMRDLARKLWIKFNEKERKGNVGIPKNLSAPTYCNEVIVGLPVIDDRFVFQAEVDGEIVRDDIPTFMKEKHYKGRVFVQLDSIKITPPTTRSKTAKLVFQLVKTDRRDRRRTERPFF